MTWTDLGVGFGLVLVIEGLMYALFPDYLRRAMAMLLSMPIHQIRTLALISIALGVGVVWLVGGSGG